MMREIQSLLISFLVMFLITFNLNVLPVEAQAAVERLTIGSFNVENLDPSDNLRFKQIAKIIVNDLNAPDILALIEVQDDNGKIDDTVTTANLTYKTLTTAIKTEGGPVYQFSDISPLCRGGVYPPLIVFHPTENRYNQEIINTQEIYQVNDKDRIWYRIYARNDQVLFVKKVT